MICLRCDNETFKESLTEIIEQEFGGETIRVESPASLCENCGWRTLTVDQCDVLFKRTMSAFWKLKAQGRARPEPIIGMTYRHKATGSTAKLLSFTPDGNGVKMRHATKVADQSWKTFYTFWKPLA